ncbi:MAG: hypothetical protein ACTSRU_17320, partial [Candidatus Hodarchaeales archaeon]
VRSSIGLRLDEASAELNEEVLGYYEVYAENMTPKYGKISFTFSNSYLSINTSQAAFLSYTL